MNTQYKTSLFLIFCALFLLNACENNDNSPAVTTPVVQGPSVRIGVVPALTVIETLKQYQPVVDYLNKKLNINGQLMPQKDYAEVLEKMRRGELDAGVFGSFLCYRAIKEIGALPLARPERQGDSTYEGLVVARKDSHVNDIYDLKEKIFAYVDRNTSAGYIYPRALLKDKRLDPNSFFKDTVFAGKHDAVVLMVLNKEADGGSAKDDVYFKLAKENLRVARELDVVHLSNAKFPDRTIAARKDFDTALAQRIKVALLDMNKDEAGRRALKAAGFDRYVSTGMEDFRQLEHMLR